VVEKSIASTRREEATVHHVVDEFFDFLREKWLRAWMRTKKKKVRRTDAHRHVHSFLSAGLMRLRRFGWPSWQGARLPEMLGNWLGRAPENFSR
jgi:hypothetical protein